ncbi:hypothetical protein J4G37_52305, partial [Microvirga sp. 3-52]|nr:hypothetical protein [Microvirga sp. 3-52]
VYSQKKDRTISEEDIEYVLEMAIVIVLASIPVILYRVPGFFYVQNLQSPPVITIKFSLESFVVLNFIRYETRKH